MRTGRILAVGGVAALLLVSVAAPAAMSYQGQVANQITVAGPSGDLVCGSAITLTATVIDAHGNPVDNQTVVWTFGAGQLTGDQIVTGSSMTNASGVATTTVILACVLGNRTVVATDAPASGQLVLAINNNVGGGPSGSPVMTASPGGPSGSPVMTASPGGPSHTPSTTVGGGPSGSPVITASPGGPSHTPPTTVGSQPDGTPGDSTHAWFLPMILLAVGAALFAIFMTRRRFVARR